MFIELLRSDSNIGLLFPKQRFLALQYGKMIRVYKCLKIARGNLEAVHRSRIKHNGKNKEKTKTNNCKQITTQTDKKPRRLTT